MTKAQFFTTPAGEEFAILPRAEYDALLAALSEDALDLAAIEAGERALAEGRTIKLPAEVGFAIAEGQNPVQILRKWRGLTQIALAEAARISKSHLSQIERGKAPGNRTRKALAQVLDVPESLLVED